VVGLERQGDPERLSVLHHYCSILSVAVSLLFVTFVAGGAASWALARSLG
jgi:hypothetical protein